MGHWGSRGIFVRAYECHKFKALCTLHYDMFFFFFFYLCFVRWDMYKRGEFITICRDIWITSSDSKTKFISRGQHKTGHVNSYHMHFILFQLWEKTGIEVK